MSDRSPGLMSPIAMEEAGIGAYRTRAGDFERLIDEAIAMTCMGTFRVYFNRHGADPLMWCIAPENGLWEIAVRSIQIATLADAVYRKKDIPDEDDGRPSAWITIEGQLTILASGHATIGSP